MRTKRRTAHIRSNCVFASATLIDKTTDASKKSFCIFISLDDLSAVSIANHILACIARLKIDINNCVGQGCDVAASMSGLVSGVQTRFEKRRVQQTTCTLASHSLNLVSNTSSQLPAVRNTIATLSDVINFTNDSAKRRTMLEVKLLTFCDTRFVQRRDSILCFAEHFSDVLSGLQDIAEAVNMDAKTKAKTPSLLSSVSSHRFWYHSQQLRKSCR